MSHYKTDLYNDQQLADNKVQVGDVLELRLLGPEGSFKPVKATVMDIKNEDAGTHPDSGEKLTLVTLTLEDVA